MKENTINIAIADDHTLFRTGLSKIIQTKRNLKVTIEASDGHELFEKLATAKVLPDICILDIEMSPMNGYKTGKELSRKYPGIKIMALSMHNSEYSIINMIRNGAKAYITKDTESSLIQYSLLQLAENGYWYEGICPSLIVRAVQSNSNEIISEKELQFLELCCSDCITGI